jgi:tetratricopeptide (TPR) repeat protein
LAESVAGLRVRPQEIQPADILPFLPQLAQIDLRTDSRPGKLVVTLAGCASTHAVATAILQQEPWEFLAVYYDTLDRAGHDFMPYHPPRMSNVSEHDFALYSGVMNGLYQFHDMLLARLLDLAGDDATVMIVSDHGFHSDHLRPMVSASTQEAQAALWHRHFGMLAMSGPGIAKDERVYGASLLDIAPTILGLFGLPIDAGMIGKPLVQAFDQPVQIDRIASWDDEPGQSGMHPPEKRSDAFASAAAVQQLIDLGYLAPTAGDAATQVAIATREAQFNLATVFTSTRRPLLAEPILRQLADAHPNEPRYVMSLAQCLMDLAKPQEAEQLLRAFENRSGGQSDSNLDTLLGQCLLAVGDNEAALQRLLRAERGAPNQPALLCLLGGAYYLMGSFDDASRAYQRAVEIDPDSEQAHFGLARTGIALQKFDDAAEHALAAVGLVHQFPNAHYALGVALEQLGQADRAERAIRTAIEMAPNFPEAHERLAALLLARGDVPGAMKHRRLAEGTTSPS